MNKMVRILSLVMVSALLLAACGQASPTPRPIPSTTVPRSTPTQAATPSTPAATPTPATTATTAPDEPLYLSLVWHQHQPLYYKDANGVYSRPWARVHATKDYYDMAAMLQNYPTVHATFNLTPVLIRQLDDFAAGAKDTYWVLSEKPANTLSNDDKRFILQRFFDANWTHIIARFPRYQELLTKRAGTDDKAIAAALQSFSEQDFRDLQIWFNLAWFDPDFLAAAPLKALVDKGKDFSEADKKIIFDKTLEVIKAIFPLHKDMQAKGQIEVITSPYAHPILPLLFDTTLASIGSPGMPLPDNFSSFADVTAQLDKSVQVYKDHFGQAPVGLWPGEGSVAQAIVPSVIKAGYTWMGSGEPVLSKSINVVFTRDSAETVQQADDLYRPYYVTGTDGAKMAVFFRDGVLSDKIGFTYSGTPGKAAAQDFMQRLENIHTQLKAQGAKGPHVVSVILDGENAWENYDNDGKDFLNSLYDDLANSKTVKTITPSEYMKLYPDQRAITNLFPGAWFQPNFETWIGEPEENTAWDYLGKVRADLAQYEKGTLSATPDQIAKALDFMYLAEGSDWFWWFGADQDSGQDDYFDLSFRSLLMGVYKSLGAPVPSFLNVPIIKPRPVNPAVALQGMSTPVIDGTVAAAEWAKAADYPSKDSSPVTDLAYTLDAKNLYFKVTMGKSLMAVQRLGFYLNVPKARNDGAFTRPKDKEPTVMLTTSAAYLFEWSGKPTLTEYTAAGDTWTAGDEVGQAVGKGDTYEFAIPLAGLGELNAGDDLQFNVVAQPQNQLLPTGGPGQIILPDINPSVVVLDVVDPQGDDNGLGTYTYPTDPIFTAKSYDVKEFKVTIDSKNLSFVFSFVGDIPNPWGSPNNLAIQTLDVYIDKDPGAGTGARLLLPGRNAALEKGNGWEYALWAEGWTPQISAPDPTSGTAVALSGGSFNIVVDPAAKTVTLRVALSLLGGGDPAKWGYAAAVLGQDGYPAAGVWRVRDVSKAAEQYRFGGAPADTNHTRIIDLIWPGDKKPMQADILGKYPASQADAGTLSPDDFAQVPLLTP